MENKTYTFWNLISKYKIEIPAIQRDYTQDRLYSDLQKDDCDIVGDIVNSLKQNKSVDLHFVYGKVYDDKNNDTKNLIPLDGQQRLTTLFLIHWFLSLGFLNDEQKEILSGFTYETRPSSADFCLKLIKESINFEEGKLLSEQVKNSKWFFLIWENDPTIKAMLNMLDVIQKKFKKPNMEFFNLLCIDKCPVVFHFLPLEKFNLDDEIYVKMNSRGKPLTDFENFKAGFSELFSLENKSKLDNEWLDIFWNLEKNNDEINLEEIDSKYLNFIKNITFSFIVEKREVDKVFKDNFNIFTEYKNIYSKSNENLNQFSQILDCLSSFEDTENYFKNTLIDDPKYRVRTIFYALSQFFIRKGKVTDENSIIFHRWMRVCANLINNTRIEGVEEFSKAIRSIKQLSENISEIYEYVSDSETKITSFLQSQVEEEKLKARLILDNSTKWKEVIEKIENHNYFNGQIGFIFNFSKIDTGYCVEKFGNYSQKLSMLFSDEFKDNHDCLFQRALLTFGNYLVDISGRSTFCKFDGRLRDKIDNWRKVFNDDKRRSYLKELLDNVNIKNLKSDLETLVKNYPTDESDWKSLFIKNNDVIKSCSNYRVWLDKSEIYLARSNADRWMRKAELRSYILFKTYLKEENFAPFENVWYWDTSDVSPCAVIDKWLYKDGKYNFVLDIRYSENIFSLTFFDRKSNNLPDEILEKLRREKFVEVEKGKVYNFDEDSSFKEVKQKIKDIVAMFSTSL